MSEWPKRDHIATSWALSGWPMPGRRLGTRYIYVDDALSRLREKGFRWRPKYVAYVKSLGASGPIGYLESTRPEPSNDD